MILLRPHLLKPLLAALQQPRSFIVSPRKLEHRFRMIHAGIPFKGMGLMMFQLSSFYCKMATGLGFEDAERKEMFRVRHGFFKDFSLGFFEDSVHQVWQRFWLMGQEL